MSGPEEKEPIDFILANVCHLHRLRAHQLLEALGLYQGQPHVLRELWKHEGLTQTDLAALLKIAPATVTKMLQRMEKAGFIQRKPDAQNRRISRVYLTVKGCAVQAEVEHVFEILQSETFTKLVEEERSLLHRLLLQIRENLLNATGEEP